MTTLLNLLAVARWRAIGVVTGNDGLSGAVLGFLFACALPMITGPNSKDPA